MKKIMTVISALVFLMLITFSITAENITETYETDPEVLKIESTDSYIEQNLHQSTLMDYDSWSE